MLGLLVISFSAGILSFVSPCIIPMLTVYFTLITGLSLDDLKASAHAPELRRRVVVNTLAFILGFGIIFTLAGGFAGQLGSLLGKWFKVLNILGGVMVLILALKLLGVFKLSFLEKLHWEPDVFRKFRSRTPVVAFLVGLLFAFACSHCIAPTLVSILLLAGATKSAATGMLVMLVFSVGLGIPYFVTGLGFSRVIGKLRATRRYQPLVTKLTGLLLLFLSYLMFTNKFLLLTTWFAKFLPYKLPLGM